MSWRIVKRVIVAVVAVALVSCALPSMVEALARVAFKGNESTLSVELRDAPPAGTPRERVRLWLLSHRSEIVAAERRFRVDRRAVAAIIAYEALADPRTFTLGPAARFAGPGKVHYREFRFAEGEPAAKEAEDAGLLPRRTMRGRRLILHSPRWSIAYIGAILSMFARSDSPYATVPLRCRPAGLATLYAGWKPSEYASTPSIRNVDRQNEAGTWTMRNLPFIEATVGETAASICRAPHQGRLPPTATPTQLGW